jgi:hypothetical protein
LENSSIASRHSEVFPGYQLPAKSDLLAAIESTTSLFEVSRSFLELNLRPSLYMQPKPGATYISEAHEPTIHKSSGTYKA